MPRQASVPLLRGTFRPVAIWTSRPHAFELHVSHTVPDFAEEDLLLHAVRESDGPADFRPRPAVALRHHMDEVLRVMGLRVALVRPEVGAILETGLRDDPAARQVLVRMEAQLEVRLDRLRLLDEPGQSDRAVRVRVSHSTRPAFNRYAVSRRLSCNRRPTIFPKKPASWSVFAWTSSITTARSPRKCTTTSVFRRVAGGWPRGCASRTL